MLTALPIEYMSIRAHMESVYDDAAETTLYEVGDLRDGTWELAISQVGPGNIGAALHAQRAIDRFHPDLLCFVGVAGGIKDVARGDVVVATKVYAYESGKDDGELRPRPEAFHSAFAVIQWAQRVALERHWLARLRYPPPWPNVVVKPMAAGEKVLASTVSTTYQYLRSQYGDAVAVDMESAGVLNAAWVNDVPAVVIRGISDLLAEKAESDAAGWQERAARNAAAFAVELLIRLQGSGYATGALSTRRTGEGPFTREDVSPPDHVASKTSSHSARLDFSISHAGADRDWAEWMAFQLHAGGYSVEREPWDWSEGADFVASIERASSVAERTLLVLTESYFTGVYTRPEWAARLSTDPTIAGPQLLPVRVEPCRPRGSLDPLVCIDLLGLDEAAAIRALLEGIRVR